MDRAELTLSQKIQHVSCKIGEVDGGGDSTSRLRICGRLQQDCHVYGTDLQVSSNLLTYKSLKIVYTNKQAVLSDGNKALG